MTYPNPDLVFFLKDSQIYHRAFGKDTFFSRAFNQVKMWFWCLSCFWCGPLGELALLSVLVQSENAECTSGEVHALLVAPIRLSQ